MVTHPGAQAGATQAADKRSIAWRRPLALDVLAAVLVFLNTMHITFTIETTPQMFANWLKQHTADQAWAGALHFPHERGTVQLQAARIESVDPHTQVMRVVMRGHNMMPLDDSTVLAAPNSDGVESITFKLVPLSAQRTEVTAGCGVPLIEPYARQLLGTIAGRYPEAGAAIRPGLDSWQDALVAWTEGKEVELPWRAYIPLPLEDVRAACYEHLERLAGKRFPADWDVYVWCQVELESVAIRYEIQSGFAEQKGGQLIRLPGHRTVGILKLGRVGGQQTRIEIAISPYGNDEVASRLREIIAVFFGRWLKELDERPPETPGESQPEGVVTRVPANLDTDGNPLPVGPDEVAESRLPPWEQIPDAKWDREAVKRLWERMTDREIARSIGKEPKTVTNRLSALRQQYPELVPKRSELPKLTLSRR